MGKRIFTNVSPKALGGMRRHYGAMGAKLRAMAGPTGEFVVEVVHPSIGRDAARAEDRKAFADEAA